MPCLFPRAIWLTLLLAAGTAEGCSCYAEDYYLNQEAWAAERLASTTDVIHARVTAVFSNGDARIQVLKALKGSGKIRLLHSDARFPTCEIRFRLGEEFIYILGAEASVHLCNRLKPTSKLVRFMEQELAKMAIPESEAPKR
jgi:hypothetical protein